VTSAIKLFMSVIYSLVVQEGVLNNNQIMVLKQVPTKVDANPIVCLIEWIPTQVGACLNKSLPKWVPTPLVPIQVGA
jgi:hypothetical protein